jgi:cell wall-associated NlpC family hydrolase
MALDLAGVGDFDGSYIITKVSWPLDGGITPATVEAVSPVDPIAEAPGGVQAAASSPTVGSATHGTKSALDFVAFAEAQAGDRYDYGATPGAGEADPSVFDCSSLVQWAAAQVGITLPRTATAQIGVCTPITVEQASRIRGALLYGAGSGPSGAHIAISLGDGRKTIEAMGRAYGVLEGTIGHRFSKGGLIKDLDYGSPSGNAGNLLPT